MPSSGEIHERPKHNPSAAVPARDNRSASLPFTDVGFWSSAIFGALLSLLVTGYAFPINNNIFHLPIIGLLYDKPEFSSDAFIQSLRHYSSGIWWMLAGSADWIEPWVLFLVLLFFSRLLCFVGFLACADYFGVRDTKQRLVFTLLISVTPFLQNVSYAGGGGLFVNYFTHTEIANGLFLLAIWAVLHAKFAIAFALVGVIFFTNAFFGVWMAFILAISAGYEVLSGRLGLKKAVVSATFGALACSVFAVPVILSILSNPDFGIALDFDYVDFLTEYYPLHFLVWTIEPRDIVRLAIVAVVGIVALSKLPDEDRRLSVIFAACILLYVVGVCVPWLTRSNFILNLHLLRSGTTIHLVSALLLSTVVVRWWFGTDMYRFAAALAVAALLTVILVTSRGHTLMYFAIIVAVASNGAQAFGLLGTRVLTQIKHHRRTFSAGTLLVVVVLAGLQAARNQQMITGAQPLANEWREVADWARDNTETGSIFLVAGEASPDFEFVSLRSVWVDWKRGAAVMWSPSYYKTWKERRNDTAELRTRDDRVTYSRLKGISHIVETTVSNCQGDVDFRTANLCVVGVN